MRRSRGKRERPVDREARVERLGNLIAGTLALYWFARGILVASHVYREAAVSFLEGLGAAGTALGHALPGISVLFIAASVALVLRPAERWVRVACLVLVAVATLGFAILDPGCVVAAFGPLTKNLAVVAMLLCLGRLAREPADIGGVERLLRYGLGATWLIQGLVVLIAPPTAQLDLAIALGLPGFDPRAVVATFAVFDALCGLALLVAPTHGIAIVALVWAQIVGACLVPAVVSLFDGGWLYHPLAPFLKNLVLIGGASCFLFLAKQDDVRFFGHLRLAERTERAAAVVLGAC